MDLTLARDFAIALFIGALVGIEREKRKATKDAGGIGGVRTFLLFAEAGAVSAWLSTRVESMVPFAGAMLAVSAVVVAGYVANARAHPDSLGLTTEAAAIAVFLLGGVTMFGHAGIAVCLGIATSAVLAFKQPIHGLIEKIGLEDLYAGLKLLIATFIVLPLLPRRAVDPWGAINPYQAWWLVILISSLSLVGYVAVRWLGPQRGTAVTGLTGGLVSSTAVTLGLARQSRESSQRRMANLLAAGILLSWTVMFVRVLVEVAVVHAALLQEVIVPFALMAAAAGGSAIALLRGAPATPGYASVPLKNPFSLTAAIRFAVLFTAILLVVRLAQTYLPGKGMYAVAALAGATDVDAITLSMANYVKEGGPSETGATAIVVAALANTALKCGTVLALGAPEMKRPILWSCGAILAVGGVAASIL